MENVCGGGSRRLCWREGASMCLCLRACVCTCAWRVCFCSVQFKMVYKYAVGKARMRSTPSLRRFSNVAFETVPMFVCLNDDSRELLSTPFPSYQFNKQLNT